VKRPGRVTDKSWDDMLLPSFCARSSQRKQGEDMLLVLPDRRVSNVLLPPSLPGIVLSVGPRIDPARPGGRAVIAIYELPQFQEPMPYG